MARRVDCIVCDDVREEAANKLSYMGAYGSEVIIGDIPGLVPKLAVCLRVFCDLERPCDSLTVRIAYAINEPIVVEVPGDDLRRLQAEQIARRLEVIHFNVNVPITPFLFQVEGRLNVDVTIDGEDIHVATVRVISAVTYKAEIERASRSEHRQKPGS